MRRRLLWVGAIGFVLIAIAHTVGHFQPAPSEPGYLAVDGAMTGYRLAMGLGMEPSLMAIYQSFSLSLVILLLMLAGNTIAALRSGRGDRGLRAVAIVNGAGSAALLALNWHHQIPPPLVSFAITTVVFLMAAAVPATGASPPE